MSTPQDYNLDVPDWRPHQYDAVQWASPSSSTNKTKIFEAPTGAGKSLCALAAGYGTTQTVVLTETRSLQQQYEESYRDCIVLKGRNNYPCIHPQNPPMATAQDCRFDTSMYKCSYKEECAYLIQKELAHASDRVVLNYAYWMITHNKWAPGFLVLDEAHNLPDVVLDHVGTTLNDYTRKKYGLPEFPTISESDGQELPAWLAVERPNPTGTVLTWLTRAISILSGVTANLSRNAHTDDQLAAKRQAENLLSKLNATKTALELRPGEHWYIRSGPGLSYYRGQAEPGLICKPLTARYDFNRFFLDRTNVLAMSATIGDDATFARELGLTDYDFLRTPSVWPAETRPVYILPCPSMSQSSAQKDESIWDKQADIIAKTILDLPPHWSGLVLVTRKKESNLLAERLARKGLQDRVYVDRSAVDGTYNPTDKQLTEWQARKRQVRNSIMVTHAFWQGVDERDSQILIAGKVPFQFRGDQYEMARERFDGRFALQRVGWRMEQGLGRVRRGEESDYNVNGEVRTFVAIADAGWSRVQKYFSAALQESIIKL